MSKLKNKTIVGLAWAMLERVSVSGVSFVIQIILARILMPEEFGVVASVSILVILAGVITEGGLGQSLVQRQDIKRIDVSTVFVMNLAIGLSMVLMLIAISPWVATFLEEPILGKVLPALSICILISSFAQTQIQMLNKNMQFKKMFKISVPSIVASGIVGIGMALTGYGVWALVGQRITERTVLAGTVWTFCDPQWRPRLEFSFESLKKATGFSLAVVGSALIFQFTRNIPGLVIAKAYGMDALGFYNRAQSFQKKPIKTLSSSLTKVLFPVFSEIQSDNQRIRSAFNLGLPILAFVVIPAMLWLISVAEPLISLVLTDKWLPSVPYLQLVPLLGITFSMNVAKIPVIKGKGLSNTIFWSSVFKNGLSLTVLFFTWRYGVLAMIYGQIACSTCNMFVNDYIVKRHVDYSMREQVGIWLPFFAIASLGVAATLLMDLTGISNNFAIMSLKTAIFALVYLGLFSVIKTKSFNVVRDKLGPPLRKLTSRAFNRENEAKF